MAKTVKVRILNEVYVAFVGLHATDLTYFYNEYAEFAPNYFFNPRFKIGQWDGKIRFFEKTGRTFLYLIEEILPKIAAMGYRVEVEDLRNTSIPSARPINDQIFAHILHQIEGTPIVLRDYQVDGVNSLIESGFGIIKAATGAGKTLITSALVTAYGDVGLRTITIVPSGDLVTGTVSEYRNCGVDTGTYSGTEKDIDHPHVVSTWQALKNNPSMMLLFDVVIVDECLDGNTLITMSDHSTKPIKEVEPGDVVITYNEITEMFEPNRVVTRHENLAVSSSERMYRLSFDNGVVLDVTGNHKLLTTDGYVRADELTANHEVIPMPLNGVT